jgi:hypothetical protein
MVEAHIYEGTSCTNIQSVFLCYKTIMENYNDIISKLPGKVFGSQIIHTVLNIIQDFLWNKWTLRQVEIKN